MPGYFSRWGLSSARRDYGAVPAGYQELFALLFAFEGGAGSIAGAGHGPDPTSTPRLVVNAETLIFSKGPHLCVGHFLARAEMRILAEAWLKRIPSFRLKPDEPYTFRLSTVLAPLSVALEWR